MLTKIDRVMIAGASSGVGKTTVTCALLQAISSMGIEVSAFKSGPDYIDPMFHSEVLGVESRNIDVFLSGEQSINRIIAENSFGKLAILEGVMGFYDGLGGVSLSSSAWHLSEISATPVILVLGCKGKSVSIAAELNGFLNFRKNNIAGVILNGATKNTYKMYADIINKYCNTKVLGYLPHTKDVEFESRKLGLITTNEIEAIKEKIKILGEVAKECIDIESILNIGRSASQLAYEPIKITPQGKCRVGIAKDKAFLFYYKDNLDILEKLGAELVYFSPLNDKRLPDNLDGLIFGGGYPELYLQELSNNITMLEDIRSCKAMPIIAECGGFMYLGDSIDGVKMVGLIETSAKMTDKLNHFGYVTLTSRSDNMLLKKDEAVNAHEFHYSASVNNGSSCMAKKPITNVGWGAIIANDNLFAGYPHIHFQGNVKLAERFIAVCLNYGKARCL